MKTQMGQLDRDNRCYEFFFSRLDTLLQVEELESVVVVRATQDTFSKKRKIFFIRELAAEGFISETYQWFSGFGEWSSSPVRWILDYSWLKSNGETRRRTNLFMIRLMAGAILLWLVMMTAVFTFTF